MAEILGRGTSSVRELYRRWGSRWNRVAADSFDRVAEEGMGSSDTGHTWRMNSSATTEEWVVRDKVARLKQATAGITHYSSVFVGYSDQRVRVRVTVGAAITAPGIGIYFRGLGSAIGDWDGLAFIYEGGTTWRILRITDAGTPSTSVLASNTLGTALSAGSTYTFEVRCLADAIEGFVDGVSQVSHTTSTNETNLFAGLMVRADDDHLFGKFRCIPYTG